MVLATEFVSALSDLEIEAGSHSTEAVNIGALLNAIAVSVTTATKLLQAP